MSLKNSITILCRVIDNYGDIGVAYRLARALDEQCAASGTGCEIRLVVDDLAAFKCLEQSINPELSAQKLGNWFIFKWNCASKKLNESCRSEDGNTVKASPADEDDVSENPEAAVFFAEHGVDVIIECFACGRPFWLENIIFAGANSKSDINSVNLFSKNSPEEKSVRILNLEYLTAEPYADEFHGQKSLTRSSIIKKYFFMPGFTDKTGGLILDSHFISEMNRYSESKEKLSVVVFNYERDFTPFINALKKYSQSNENLNISVNSASGKCAKPISDAWNSCGKPFSLKILPFMNQLEWDCVLCSSDILFVRGEDSLSRAALIGRPFVWQAYPQTEEYQLVKVKALLERMKPFFEPDIFSLISDLWLTYNGEKRERSEEELLFNFFCAREKMQNGFKTFAQMLLKNGNLAVHLMTFISKIM